MNSPLGIRPSEQLSKRKSKLVAKQLHTALQEFIQEHLLTYRNDPKFSDRYAWANSADPAQTAPRGAV